MKQGISVALVIFSVLLIVGAGLFLFPPPVAIATPTTGDDGSAADDLAGSGMEFIAVGEDGNEYPLATQSIFAGSVWVGDVPVSNVYARVKVSYDIVGFEIDTEHPLTITTLVRINNWFAEDPDNDYYALTQPTNVDPFYDVEDPNEVIIASWDTTTSILAQTDFVLGKVYLAPQSGEISLFTTGDINDAVLFMWNWIHSGDSVVGKTLTTLFESRIKIGGSYETIQGWVDDAIWSDWSMNYALKMGLSSGTAPGGTVTVQIGSFSLEGGSQDMSIPLLLMIFGGGGIFLTLVATPIIEKRMR
jgi:hypothetical protein